MLLSGGSRLGHFEILGPVGAGGMGEVYKARDTRLDRTVAIKVLAAKFAGRGALNHPHICTLFDVGEQDGRAYLVMELLDGASLAAHLRKGPLPVERALRFGAEIAEALDFAHRNGITHRDLKPGNIMVTPNGVKLLDFGLAKISQRAGPDDATMTQSLTAEGAVIGTYPYMAPEQLEAKDSDSRAAIFAFGAVLFEMFTGQRAFRGDTQAGLIAAIMATPPEALTAAPPPLPPAIGRVIRRCLARDPDDRWQTARDLAAELRWIAETSGVAQPALPARPAPVNKLRRRAGWMAAAALIPLGVISVMHMAERPPEQKPLHFEISIPDAASLGWFQYPSVAPDGASILLSGMTREGPASLWMRHLASRSIQKLPGPGGYDHCWSADSQILTYTSGRNIMRLDIGKGEPVSIGLLAEPTYGVACSPAAVLLGSNQGPLLHMNAAGGEIRPLTQLDQARGETAHQYPQFLPDGVRFLFTAAGVSGGAVFAGSLKSPEVKLILPAPRRAVYVNNGYLLYAEGGAIVARRMDAGSMTLTGEPVRVAESVFRTPFVPSYAAFSANPDLLAYRLQQDVPLQELTWFDRAGKRAGTLGEAGAYSNPALSPDERRLAVSRTDLETGNRDIWIIDLKKGSNTRLTFDAADDLNPVWSSDGSEIFFSSDRTGARKIYRKPASGTSGERALGEGTGSNSVLAVSGDGKTAIFNDGPGKLWMFAVGGGRPRLAAEGQGVQEHAALSPDGKWMAYRSTESGRGEIYVQHFPPVGGKWQVSTAGGSEPAWRGDGKELYYIQGGSQLVAVAVSASGGGVEVGKPVVLFEAPITGAYRRNRFVVTRDGARFLIVTEQLNPQGAKFNVVVNWAAGLGK
jgi:serine/threonine protein kinase/Tol biopolymer transport system component